MQDFPDGGANPQKWGIKRVILANFSSRKLHKNEKQIGLWQGLWRTSLAGPE